MNAVQPAACVRESAELDVFNCALDGVTQIEASAGTGKTWNICALYLRLLLEKDLTVDRILVVTYTRAASAELRERIRARLMALECALCDVGDDASARQPDAIARGDSDAAEAVPSGAANGDPDHGSNNDANKRASKRRSSDGPTDRANSPDRTGVDDPLLTGLLASARRQGIGAATVRQRARRALRWFDQAAIHTIHAFCQRALQEAPFAAAMPFSLELIPDDERLRLELALDFWCEKVESRAAQDAGFAAWLVRQRVGPGMLVDELARRLRKPLARLLFDTSEAAFAPEAQARHARCFEQAAALFSAEREALMQLLDDARPALKQTSHRPEHVRRALATWTRYFAQGDSQGEPADDARRLTALALTEATKLGHEPPRHAFFTLAEELVAYSGASARRYRACWLALLREWLGWAPEALRQRKQARREISFDDLLTHLHAALGARPWLARALRARYPAALIDEFQDTDPLQFEIFSTVFAPDGPLFLVGDPKQAIYSFRAADLHAYLRAREHTHARYTLAENQRSTPALIAACNRLFSVNRNAFVLPGLQYVPVRAARRERTALRDALSDSSEQTSALRVWLLPEAEPPGKSEAQRLAAGACAQEIARLLRAARDGRALLGDVPLRPGDMAVLVQTHKQGALAKRTLAAWGVGSVELAQASVFDTVEAEQLQRVLLAVEAPSDLRRLRAALACDWFGLDAAALWRFGEEAVAGAESAALAQESDLASWVERFSRYRAAWLERGFAPMWRALSRELGIATRLGAGADGERRLTDLSHLAELAQAYAARQTGIAPVLRWLATQRARRSSGEDAQLRLESDRDLVQIVTVHKAKGLEYALVFCPFLLFMPPPRRRAAGALPPVCEYHDAEGDAVMHYLLDEHDPMAEAGRQAVALEQAGEAARLIYVALTRAIHRCYLIGGVYASGAHRGTKEACRSVLHWLLHDAGRDFSAWRAELPAAEHICQRWRGLHDGVICVEALPEVTRRVPVPPLAIDARSLRARRAARVLVEGWRIASFTSLVAGGAHIPAATHLQAEARPDHDALSVPLDGAGSASLAGANGWGGATSPSVAPAVASIERDTGPGAGSMAWPDDDILHFPRGATAGETLHRLFELVDFGAPASWPRAIERALRERAQPLPPEIAGRWPAMLERLLAQMSVAPLGTGFTLSRIDSARRLNELEFVFPAPALDLGALRRELLAHGYPEPPFAGAAHAGYIKGFVDMVFEHGGRFWIVDWKSNFLGETPDDYRGAALDAAMSMHAYHVQALIYSLAMHRYLRLRMPGYDYEAHFGGCLYLFVRGLREAWADRGSPAGIYLERPRATLIDRLDALMSAVSS